MSRSAHDVTHAACSFGWACLLLDREEVLLAGLV